MRLLKSRLFQVTVLLGVMVFNPTAALTVAESDVTEENSTRTFEDSGPASSEDSGPASLD